jgi:hypothetical protein
MTQTYDDGCTPLGLYLMNGDIRHVTSLGRFAGVIDGTDLNASGSHDEDHSYHLLGSARVGSNPAGVANGFSALHTMTWTFSGFWAGCCVSNLVHIEGRA